MGDLSRIRCAVVFCPVHRPCRCGERPPTTGRGAPPTTTPPATKCAPQPRPARLPDSAAARRAARPRPPAPRNTPRRPPPPAAALDSTRAAAGAARAPAATPFAAPATPAEARSTRSEACAGSAAVLGGRGAACGCCRRSATRRRRGRARCRGQTPLQGAPQRLSSLHRLRHSCRNQQAAVGAVEGAAARRRCRLAARLAPQQLAAGAGGGGDDRGTLQRVDATRSGGAAAAAGAGTRSPRCAIPSRSLPRRAPQPAALSQRRVVPASEHIKKRSGVRRGAGGAVWAALPRGQPPKHLARNRALLPGFQP